MVSHPARQKHSSGGFIFCVSFFLSVLLSLTMSGVLSEEVQLGYALEAFGWAHQMGAGWATAKLLYLKSAGISSMADLSGGCKDQTINLDLELFGVPPEERLTDYEIERLQSFLPGPVGFRCFRLAQKAAMNVRKGQAETNYVHRPESGKIGEEKFKLSTEEPWILHVDCAGFVRNCLKHVTKDPFVMSLSDRDFMRAKDFFCFFQNIPYSVMDLTPIAESNRRMRWRKVDDLRMVIPGDVICYRPRGNAAGGAAFTTNDRKDLNHLLRAVKTAQLWRDEDRNSEWKNLVTTNVSKDHRVRPWVQAVKGKLNAIGIKTVKDFHQSLQSVNGKLRAMNYPALHRDTLALARECAETTAKNTGHIVFASGPAVLKGNGQYRIRVVHSTSTGFIDSHGNMITGVQEYYRRFTLIEKDGKPIWTRDMKLAKPLLQKSTSNNGNDGILDDTDDDPLDDMEDVDEGLPTERDDDNNAEPTDSDELAGQLEVEVIAARMCF